MESEEEAIVDQSKYGTFDSPNILNKFTDQVASPGQVDVNLSENDYDEDTYGLWIGSNKADLVSGITLLLQQFKALTVKRAINSLRNRGLVISQFIVPIIILLITLIQITYGPIQSEGKSPVNT